MGNIERFISHQDYIDLSDNNGEMIEYIAVDFQKRKEAYGELDPLQIRLVAMMEREKKKRRWLAIAFITGVLSVLSWGWVGKGIWG